MTTSSKTKKQIDSTLETILSQRLDIMWSDMKPILLSLLKERQSKAFNGLCKALLTSTLDLWMDTYSGSPTVSWSWNTRLPQNICQIHSSVNGSFLLK